MIRINCISSPRNISTALMYAFAQRSDTTVVDEPFYAHYLLKTGKDHPGREDVLRSQSTDAQGVFSMLNRLVDRPVLYVKNMAKHMEVIEDPQFEDYIPLFLIRDPLAIIASFDKGYPNPGMDDIGLPYLHQLYQEGALAGSNPVILDTTEVLKNPRRVLSIACEQLRIPFDEAMLSWPAGPRKEDGVWARYWYHSVHNSTGFAPYQEKHRALPQHLRPLYDEALPLYEQLYLHAIKAI